MQTTKAVSAEAPEFDSVANAREALERTVKKQVDPLVLDELEKLDNTLIGQDLAQADAEDNSTEYAEQPLTPDNPDSPQILEEKGETLFDKFANLLSPVPILKNAFVTYAGNQKMANGVKIQDFIAKTANQLSIASNLLGLVLPNSKPIEFLGKYAYRGMVGIAALGKFSKVSKNNDLIASASGLFKVLSAFNVFHLLSLPLKAMGMKDLNLNIGFSNVYSFFGAANGPMNISSSANKRKMGAEGFKNPMESVKAFTNQLKDAFAAISENGVKAFDPTDGTGVNGTIGGILQIIGFATKQTGLHMRNSGNAMGEALITTGNVLRDNLACFCTDLERFSIDNMERGRIQSVASGGNYSSEGVLDVLLNLPFMKPYERQIESLMGLFGTWAAACNTAAVKEENAEFVGDNPIPAKNLPHFVVRVFEAMVKANAGHCLPESIANMFNKKAEEPSLEFQMA